MPIIETESDAQRDEMAKANLEQVQKFSKLIPPAFINGVYIIGDSDCIRLIIGQIISGEFVPTGHLVMTHDQLEKLSTSIGEFKASMNAAQSEQRKGLN